MKPRARAFVLLSMAITAGLAGGLALLNYIVDPANRYGHNRLGVYISADRECKAAGVRRYPHDALLLGNSRIAGIRPKQLTGMNFFNGAFAAATSEEVYYFVQHYAENQKVVILGVDLGACDPAEPKGDIFALTCASVLDNLFNLQTVEYSIRTISEYLSGVPNPVQPDGAVDLTPWLNTIDRENPPKMNFELDRMKNSYRAFHCQPKERMGFYARIAQCLEHRGIPCLVIIPPVHEVVTKEILATPGCSAELAAWKKQLSSIFPHVLDLSDSQYNTSASFFRSDPIHFRQETGERMMNSEVVPVALRLLQEKTTDPLAVGR
jgi:hypothetical protein